MALPNAVSARVVDMGPDQFEVATDPQSPDDVLLTLGDTLVTVPAAAITLVKELSPSQFEIENSAESLQPITAEIDGQVLEIMPGTPAAVLVAIDIKPGNDINSVNLGSNGTVPVAILSSASFDATTVDPVTVTLSGSSVKLRGRGTAMVLIEDVNGDGWLDQVIHVSTDALELSSSDTEAVLEGQTVSGVTVRGVDQVRILH